MGSDCCWLVHGLPPRRVEEIREVDMEEESEHVASRAGGALLWQAAFTLAHGCVSSAD